MASNHEYIDFHLDDMDEMVDSCVVKVTIREVHHAENTCDVTHEVLGDIDGVTMFYHCEDASWSTGGQQVFRKDDEVLMFIRGQRQAWPHIRLNADKYVFGFANGRPKWCKFEQWGTESQPADPSLYCYMHRWMTEYYFYTQEAQSYITYGWVSCGWADTGLGYWMDMADESLYLEWTGLGYNQGLYDYTNTFRVRWLADHPTIWEMCENPEKTIYGLQKHIAVNDPSVFGNRLRFKASFTASCTGSCGAIPGYQTVNDAAYLAVYDSSGNVCKVVFGHLWGYDKDMWDDYGFTMLKDGIYRPVDQTEDGIIEVDLEKAGLGDEIVMVSYAIVCTHAVHIRASIDWIEFYYRPPTTTTAPPP